MTVQLSPGGPAGRNDLRTAQNFQRLARDELPSVRAAAAAWRNGLAGLLAGLLGFSLIKGRSDISLLADPWDIAVGGLLSAALLAGAWGALRLLGAAHGRPAITERSRIGSDVGTDHREALRAARGLRSGIALTLVCSGLLAAAVGVTWYGPEKSEPGLQILTPQGRICGSVVRLSAGTLTLKTADGVVAVDLRTEIGIRPVASCP